MITLVDYGIGNLRSLQKALECVGAAVHRTSDPTAVAAAERLVLPGVGAFGACADALASYGLDTVVVERARAGVPLLGVCVGMQLLFEGSDERGRHAGLGLLPGEVRRLAPRDDAGRALKVPHMGWNRVRAARPHPVSGAIDGAHVYFVHSYAAAPASGDLLAEADYGGPVAAAVGRANVLGVQFHPEKSQSAGLALLRAFTTWQPAGQPVPA